MVQADSNSEASAEDSLEFESGSLKIQGFSYIPEINLTLSLTLW